jgi:hypothetical protein
MDKIKINLVNSNGKLYAVFHVNPQFASKAFWAGYHDLPRDEKRVEVKPGCEEQLIAEVKEKIAAAEAAIAKHEEFIQSPAETHTIEVAGYNVTIHFEPTVGYRWQAQVFIPAPMKAEANLHTMLGEHLDEWREEDDRFSLSTIVKDKEEYFSTVKAEMEKVAEELEALRTWRSQPTQHYELPGSVSVTITPDDRWSRYEAEVIAPKALIDKAKACGLKLGQRIWGSKNEHFSRWWCPLRDETELARILAELRSEIEETLNTEIVAQYSVN